MKATKDYGPCYTCDKPIKKGDDFVIQGGEFFHSACRKQDSLPARAMAAAGTVGAPPDAKPQPRKRAAAKPKARSRPKPKSKRGGTGKRPSARPAPKAKAKPKRTVTKVAESPNGITVRLLCGRQSTDDKIMKAVLKQFPDRNEKRIRADISINRHKLNGGGYRRARKKYGLGHNEKLIKVG